MVILLRYVWREELVGGSPKVLGEAIHNCLICGHHDGCVRDLPHQLGAQAPVDPAVTFLLRHCRQSLPERSVLAAFLSESCASHFYNMTTQVTINLEAMDSGGNS